MSLEPLPTETQEDKRTTTIIIHFHNIKPYLDVDNPKNNTIIISIEVVSR